MNALRHESGRRPRRAQAAAAAVIVGVAAAVLVLVSTANSAAAQFDDEAQPGTCVMADVIPTDLSQGQCDALNALYWATRGPDWTEQRGWNTTTDPCTWGGVSCADGNGHAVVERIELHDNGLAGYLPEQVEGLRWLQKLRLSSNDIGGVIPEQIGLLQQLRVLDLSGNRFEGEVPGRLGDLLQLRVLNLSDNMLTGQVPVKIVDLDQLVQLRLASNDCLVVRTVTGRVAEALVEAVFMDHCARVKITSSCLAGNGRVDIEITNESAVSRTYSADIGHLPTRERLVRAGETATITATGRADGRLPVMVRHGTVELRTDRLSVDCDPDIAAIGRSRCVQGEGRLDVVVSNASEADERVWVAVDDLPLRAAVVPAGGEHIVTIAVALGDRLVSINSNSEVVAPFTTRVLCT